MDAFARCYLLVFGQLAVGGFMALAAPPFREIERGFFKSSAGIFLGLALAALAGEITLLARAAEPDAYRTIEVGAWGLFAIAAGAYLASLWGERMAFRARMFTAASFTGLAALSVAAQRYRLAGPFSPEAVLYPVNFALSALVLGAAATGMSLGHWYLIDRGLSIEPLRRVWRLLVTALIVQVAAGAIAALIFWLAGSPATIANLRLLAGEHRTLLVARILAGPVAALVLAAMIRRTLLIPQTMAATGLFYIAVLAVIVGEMLGRLILFRTNLPL